jgi:hypothetical protein
VLFFDKENEVWKFISSRVPQPSSEPQSQRRQFPESNLNFRLPIWEKIVFFLLGSIGFDLIGSLFYYPFKLAVDGKAMSANLANSLIMFLSYFAWSPVSCFSSSVIIARLMPPSGLSSKTGKSSRMGY